MMMKKLNRFFILGLFAAGFSISALTGCTKQSYPADRLKESLMKICRSEYGIEEIDVKVVGDTIGVYLPLKKLFAADFKDAVVTGKVRNLETLFEPSPEALEKVEDVLFSISRVILSTDKTLKFYVLQATDIEKTGLQLILVGYVDDVKRVRLWDISRDEYRKRVIHELRLNHAVVWHRPVHEFFKDLEALPISEVRKKYFSDALPVEALQNLFLSALLTGGAKEPHTKWEVVDMRSTPIRKSEILVYTRVKPMQDAPGTLPKDQELAYIFMLTLNEEEARISRIIPFQYRDAQGNLKKISFPQDLQIEKNLEKWETEFSLEEVHVGSFLAQQLTRRAQTIVATDERIQNTFREIKLTFEYRDDPRPVHFSLNLEATLRDFNHYSRTSLVFHEDMLYLLNIASREFVDVLRSYQFGDYDYLSLKVAQEPSQWIIGRDSLELFRRKKVDLQGLLSLPSLQV